MSTSQNTMDYIIDQLAKAGDVRARKMFGEYALYCDEKVVGLVCDNQLLLKPTAAGKKILGSPVEAPPYPGAKDYYLISDDLIEDRDELAALVRATADEVPLRKPKKRSGRSVS